MAEGGGAGNTQTPPGNKESAHKSKAVRAGGLVIGLVVVIVILLFIAFWAKDFLPTGPRGPSGGETAQPHEPGGGLVDVGTPGGSSTVSENGAMEAVIEEAFRTGNEIAYLFCRQLQSGDKVATQGDPDKYSVEGPVWFAYVDEVPGAFFEHDVRYIFIDASTGEKTVYEESWPPDINGEDMFNAGEDCGGVIEIQAI